MKSEKQAVRTSIEYIRVKTEEAEYKWAGMLRLSVLMIEGRVITGSVLSTGLYLKVNLEMKIIFLEKDFFLQVLSLISSSLSFTFINHTYYL